ncbi:hypothetical protein [uncultured Shimia sp.]|uniref:hypothetical protein n=1 Tax=uncultured Shimia sp. TaxID=573152 RepID=UPI0025DBAF46|nr:hypothetical protein [uncultured Shimia sp.]
MKRSQSYLGNFARAAGKSALCVADAIAALFLGRADKLWTASATVLFLAGFLVWRLAEPTQSFPEYEHDMLGWGVFAGAAVAIIFVSSLVRRWILKRGKSSGES